MLNWIGSTNFWMSWIQKCNYKLFIFCFKQSYNNGNFVKNFNIKGKIDKVLSKFFKL